MDKRLSEKDSPPGYMMTEYGDSYIVQNHAEKSFQILLTSHIFAED